MSGLDSINKTIWVLDPGMMEAGGHHAALAETLCQIKHREPNTSINVFAHKLLDEKLQERFFKSDISTSLSFDSVFYQYFHGGVSLGPAGLQKYIRTLALEYKILLELAIRQALQQRVVIFLPALNWEHACAFSHTLTILNTTLSERNIHIVACAMFPPKPNEQEPDTKVMWYKMAFSALNKYQYFSLYCSEKELCLAYNDLLFIEHCGAHPCYLMDWDGEKVEDEIVPEGKGSTKSFLLYLGDAKVDKGFNRLPEVLTQALATATQDTEFIIQFTLAWEYPEIMDTVNTLKDWAITEPRIILHHGFWSNQEMVNMFRRVNGVICTYDTNTYKYKSSGLVWMLAFFNKPFVVSAECWLSREAGRLNVPVVIDKSLQLRSLLETKAPNKLNKKYASSLYKSLSEWLLSH